MTWFAWYELLVLLGGFLLLTGLALRGQSVYLAAPLAAILVLACSGVDPVVGMTGKFMEGFAEYLRNFYLIFALGAAFGRIMDKSGAAAAVARGVVRLCGARWACLAVVLACAILTYGGVSLFVVGFAVYPLAVQLFREANLPRRFIPAAIAFGSVTFTMTSAGSPEIQNLIPINYLYRTVSGTNGELVKESLTDARAGWPASLVVAVVMFGLGQMYLEGALRRAIGRGERFVPRPDDPPTEQAATNRSIPENVAPRPGLAAALWPLVVTLLVLNLLPFAESLLAATVLSDEAAARLAAHLPRDNALATFAIFVGLLTALGTLRRFVSLPSYQLSEGFMQGLIAIGSTCCVVGFGSAMRSLPAFQRVTDWVTGLPIDPLVGAALAVAIIAGLAGSASGGQGIALPIIKPIYIDQLDVAPRALHRVVSIASGTLDTLPANGFLVILIRNICGETHQSSYWPICVTCTLLPMLGTGLAILLFKWFPAWQQM